MPRPKTGTIIIKRDGNKTLAYIRNQGGQEFLAEGLGDILRDFHGKVCTFMARGGIVQQVSAGGTTHDAKPDRPEAPAKEKPISAGEAWQTTREATTDFAFDKAPEPELSEASPCQPRKPMPGKNLFDGNEEALKVPHDTAMGIKSLFGTQKGKNKLNIDNFALVLNKCVHFIEINRQGKAEYKYSNDYSKGIPKPLIFRQTFDDRSERRPDGKPKRIPQKFEIEFDFPPELIAHAKTRQQHLIAGWEAAGWQTTSQNFTPDFRLVMGLGTASVFETSLTLHHIYGIPYLPASSIKGVTRSWVIINYFNQDEKQAMADPLFAYLFGSDTNGPDKKAHRGQVMFFDAFPQSPPVIEPDIMNVHYPDWYSKGKPPTDTQSPNPIPFLTVGKCDANQQPLQVRFDLAVRNDVSCESIWENAERRSDLWQKLIPALNLNSQTKVLTLAHQLLSSALTSHGLGAKTAIGYGFFQSP